MACGGRPSVAAAKGPRGRRGRVGRTCRHHLPDPASMGPAKGGKRRDARRRWRGAGRVGAAEPAGVAPTRRRTLPRRRLPCLMGGSAQQDYLNIIVGMVHSQYFYNPLSLLAPSRMSWSIIAVRCRRARRTLSGAPRAAPAAFRAGRTCHDRRPSSALGPQARYINNTTISGCGS